MAQDIIKLTDFPEFNISPFAKELVTQVSPGKASKMGHSYGNNGTFIAQTQVCRDNNHFIKVFSKNLKIMFDLYGSDMKVLSYVMSSSGLGSDQVLLRKKECCEHSGLALRTINRSIIALIDKGFIARTDSINVYWINPNRFFKGNRLTLVNEYVEADKARKHDPLPSKEISTLQRASPLNHGPVMIPRSSERILS